MLSTQNHLVHLRGKKKNLYVLILKSQVQRDLPTCQGYLVKRQPTDVSYVFPEAGLTLLRVFLLSLPLGSFTSNFFSLSCPSPRCPVFASWITMLCLLCLFLPFSSAAVPSIVRLHVHRNKVYLCWQFSALNLRFTPWSDDHPSFHFIFFSLHVLIEFLPQPHLVHHVSDSQALISMLYDRLNGALLLVIQALKN